MKVRIKEFLKKLAEGPMEPVFFVVWSVLTYIDFFFLNIKWVFVSPPKPNAEQQKLVRENVTFVYKSFERQAMAKRLYRNIQRYYPGVQVIIADDSRKPLDLQGAGLKVIQLPFNSGLSIGLNRAIEQVRTPFVIRLDDDELITPYSNFHGQLEFLMAHPEVDLVGISHWNIPREIKRKRKTEEYARFTMRNAPKELKIPHMTKIDENHVVLGKVPNIFLVRTEKLREVGYDDNIRMIDHHEFFYRAAGNVVSVLDDSCYVLHYHNPYHRAYQRYRSQIQEDLQYIRMKRTINGARVDSGKAENQANI